MSTSRIAFRCPNCGTEGKARPELLGRRVACKACSHIFRAQPGDDGSASAEAVAPPPPPDSAIREAEEASRRLLDSLRAEAGRLRIERDAASRDAAEREKSAEARIADLERRLAEPRPDREGFLLRELDSLRAQYEGALDERDRARERAEAGDRLRADLDTARTAEAALRESEAEAQREVLRLADRVRELEPRAESAGRLEGEAARLRARLEEVAQAGPATVVDVSTGPFRDLSDLRDERDRLRAEVAEVARERDEARAAAAEAERARAALDADHTTVEADLRAENDQIRRDSAEAVARAVRDGEAVWARDRRSLEVEIEQFQRAWREEREKLQDEVAIQAARADAAEARAAANQSEADRLRDELAGTLERQAINREAAEAHAAAIQAESARAAAAEARAAAVQAEADRLCDETAASLQAQSERAEKAEAEAGAEGLRAARSEARLEQVRHDAERDQEDLRAEVHRLRAEVDRLRSAAPDAAGDEDAAPAPLPPPPADSTSAVQSAWVDFERRLAETQARLRAANERAHLLEAEARQASADLAELRQQVETGLASSAEEFAVSMTHIAIMNSRAAPALTWPEAEARLDLVRQLAAERKDRHLIERVNRCAETVGVDLDQNHSSLAESLVRGMEIETGIDPGGWSTAGLKLFRPSPTLLKNLAALAPACERVMHQADRASTQATVAELKTILGTQAGLPGIRRPGRTPGIKRPTSPAEAAGLFLDVLAGENWLIRPIESRIAPPDRKLSTYAAWVEGCAEVRDAVAHLLPERLEGLDRVLAACVGMLVRRQTPDGHFPFLDPRSLASPLGAVVDEMVARQPNAVRDGWVVAVDPAGAAQVETGVCGAALARAGAAAGRPDWTEAAVRAAGWAAGQPNLPQFLANAQSCRLLALGLAARPDARLARAITDRVGLGLLAWQADNGRWLDASAAQTPNHLVILLALLDASIHFPADAGDELRAGLDRAIDRGLDDLLRELAALGVPADGSALPVLIRARERDPDHAPDARLRSALLDSVTVIRDACQDGARPRLGVAPDVLAALVRS